METQQQPAQSACPGSKSSPNRSRRNFLGGAATVALAAGQLASWPSRALAQVTPPGQGGLPPGLGGGGPPGQGGGGPPGLRGAVPPAPPFRPICFLAGTQIQTPDGECPIETLAVGQYVTTASGQARPVRWVARMQLRRQGTCWGRGARPVRIQKDAIGPNVPSRDLYVSEGHALLIDGVLVTASLLVNGQTVARVNCEDIDTLTYYHIELADHDVVLANGVPTETLQANENRKRFDNYGEYVALYGTSSICLAPYAPAYGRGGRALLASRLRRLIAPIWDCRTAAEHIYDAIALRGQRLSGAHDCSACQNQTGPAVTA
jgi:hypothetical protein